MFELISRVPSKYYLAYGSNLDMERMGKRCPYAVVVGTTEIKGYRLLFKKSKTGCYATIEQDAKDAFTLEDAEDMVEDQIRMDKEAGREPLAYDPQFFYDTIVELMEQDVE